MVSTLLFLLTTVLLSSEAQKYYVTPTPPPNPACPSGMPCHTLNYYASLNASSLFSGKENVSLLLLDGNHTLPFIHIAQVNFLNIAAVINSTGSRVTVIAKVLIFEAISVLVIENIYISANTLFAKDVTSISVDTQFHFSPETTHAARIEKFGCKLVYVTPETESAIRGTVEIRDTKVNGLVVIDYRKASLTNISLTLTIDNCLFSNLINASLRVYNSVGSLNATVRNTVFTETGVRYGAAVEIDIGGSGQLNTRRAEGIQSAVLLQNVSFISSAPAAFFGPVNVTVDSCHFDKNIGIFSGAIEAIDVNLFFVGNTTFSNNNGRIGGAIYMSGTTMWLEKGTNISFTNNTASLYGGAITVEETTHRQRILYDFIFGTQYLPPACLYQLTFDIDNLEQTIPVLVTFENNSAQIGGVNIYGVGLNGTCKVTPNQQWSSYQIQRRIFQFKTPTLSSVSSSPRRVCLCENGVPQCGNFDYIYFNVSVMPGEKFNFSVVLVGEDFGTVTGGVYASYIGESQLEFDFGPRQDLQQITQYSNCTELVYSIKFNEEDENVTFILSSDSTRALSQEAVFTKPEGQFERESIANDTEHYKKTGHIGKALLFAPVIISTRILPCPLGFALLNSTCHCERDLTVYVHNCVVVNNTGILYRNETTWISSAPGKDNSSDVILAHNFCPFDYCVTDTIGVDLYNPDVQCALGHSGVLCGGCPPDLNLAIGSSRCLHCPNNNFVTLLLVFLVAGIALVIFIKIMDLTVVHGRLNGLIFYANVIWINQGIFFPSSSDGINNYFLTFFQIMKGFVAWLNLDFGIETCFIKGLDAYRKTWLQFVFPVYLWILAGLIILVCHYSARATKLFGNNAVAVLATLFLMTYVKLLRTIVAVLGPAVLQQYHPEGTKWVWLLDGNLSYLGLSHAFLFVVAILVLLFLWLPYTIIILFVHHFKKLSCNCISRFVNKFRPLLGTYTGPLKDKHQYWVGLTLLVRVILAVTAASFLAISPTVSIALLLITSALLCLLASHVFKEILNVVLELFFLLNLLILCTVFLSTDVIEKRITSVCVSVFISFITFITIIAYHICSPLVKKYWNNTRARSFSRDSRDYPLKVSDHDDFVTSTSVNLREELLGTVDDN